MKAKLKQLFKGLVTFLERVIIAKNTYSMPGTGISIVNPGIEQTARETATRVAWLFFEYVQLDLSDGKADALERLESWMKGEIARIRGAPVVQPK